MSTLRYDDGPDARTIEALVCPYREVTTVDDGDDAGAYEEMFVAGAFSEQVAEAPTKPPRIWLHLAHRKESVFGHATRLTETDGGLYGAFAVGAAVAGDKLLAAVREGVLTGVSMQATPLRSCMVDGVTHRQKARLAAVSIVPAPAYPSARVIGIRKAFREPAGPTSPDEYYAWELDRQDGKLRALISQCIDETPRYTHSPRYQRLVRLHEENAEERAEIERRLRPQPKPEAAVLAEALRPKTIRRVVSGPITVR
jgi:HK97 family phage prohead protease